MKEIWKEITGFEGLYAVSNLGKVKSLKNDVIMKVDISNGYERVPLFLNKKCYKKYVHRLVAEAFVPNVENKPSIDHIDTNPFNNVFTNLRWCTQKENINNPITIKNKSKPHTKEWAENIRKGLQKNPIICVETGIVYEGQMDAQRKTGVFQSNIRKVLIGERKTAGGCHWRYIEHI